MKKLALFLDIDGVLNSNNSPKEVFNKQYPIDKRNVRALKSILKMLERKEFEVDIILSSTWRLGKTIEMINEIFEPYDIVIKDKTSKIDFSDRGTEIKRYIEQHDEYTHCIVFDDDIDMGRMTHFFVPIDSDIGLEFDLSESLEIYKEIEKVLNRPYNLWRLMDWVITSKELLGDKSYYSNQPPKWITTQYYSWRKRNNELYNSSTFAQFLKENTTGLVLIPVDNEL